MPAAVALTFGTMLLTVGYMERVLNKKINLDIRIAKEKARFNAESGSSITISGDVESGFVPSIGSSSWPSEELLLGNDESENVIDLETFSGVYKPEQISQIFPNASLTNTPEIDMGEFYNIRLELTTNEITRRPERIGTSYGRAKVKNIFGNDIFLIDSANVRFEVEVISDFMYLTQHELAGGGQGVFGWQGNPQWRRQPSFGEGDNLGNTEQSVVGFTQTLEAMRITGAPQFDNLVYVTEATCDSNTDPQCWWDAVHPNGQPYNWTNVPLGEPIFPENYGIYNIDQIFTSTEADHEECANQNTGCGWERREPVCFPLVGYKETVLTARADDTFDSTEMMKQTLGPGGPTAKDTLIMTDLQFLPQGGYKVKRWWYLIPPYLKAGGPNNYDLTGDLDGINGSDILSPMPYHLEGMPDMVDPANPDPDDEINAYNALCNRTIQDNGWGDLTSCEPYEDAMLDFHNINVDQYATNPLQSSGAISGFTYDESFQTNWNDGQFNGDPGGGIARFTHFDIENFTKSPARTNPGVNDGYFENNNWTASNDWNLNVEYPDGNLIEERVVSHSPNAQVVIHVKGGPVRVHGTFNGAYTVVTSGWDRDNEGYNPGQAGYEGYVRYKRHAWPNNVTAPYDTLRANIWLIDDLTNVDTASSDCQQGAGACPTQPCIRDNFGDVICTQLEPGDCGGSDNIMGLVSSANVVIANTQANRNNIRIHASITALNESFVMHVWQNGHVNTQNPPRGDGRGRDIYGNEPTAGQFDGGRGNIELCGGIIQTYRGYMKRGPVGGQYDNGIPGQIGMDKLYNFDNNLYFPPPGAISVEECESGTVRMSMVDIGRPE